MDFIKAFLIGGAICVVGQILIDKTRLTSAKILVLFVVIGVVLGGFGLYQPLVDFAGAGASVPLPGFGNLMARGIMREIDTSGFLGILTGALKAGAAGIMAAMLFSFLAALIFEPKAK